MTTYDSNATQKSFKRAYAKAVAVEKTLAHKRRGSVKFLDDWSRRTIFISCYGKNVAKFKY